MIFPTGDFDLKMTGMISLECDPVFLSDPSVDRKTSAGSRNAGPSIRIPHNAGFPSTNDPKHDKTNALAVQFVFKRIII